MKIYIDGDINRSYVQTLCMVFFPGMKFSESEEITPDTPILNLKQADDREYFYACAELSAFGRKAVGKAKENRISPSEEHLAKKRVVGIAVYKAGCELLGYTPSWGILTGVRPAKFANELTLRESKANPEKKEEEIAEKVRDILEREYYVSPKKASLLTSVVANEERLKNSLPKDSCSIYISIPFCPTRCSYCSFVSYSTKRLLSMIPEYLERLCCDIREAGKTIREIGQKPLTVYIGGGTPSILSPKQIKKLLCTINENIDMSGVREFTLEAGRPDTITKEKLKTAVENGATRVSINPQTMNDEILKAIGRRHTAEDFLRAFDEAREAEVPCINTDLIAGLPGESFASFSHSVDVVSSLLPENLTVHTFCVKKAAELCRSEFTPEFGGSDASKSVDYSQLKARIAGYHPYYMYRQKNTMDNLENVGYSLPGKEGLYNIFIMEEVHSIFALGAGAVTKMVSDDKTRIERLFMPKYPYEYLERDKDEAMTEFKKGILDFYENKYRT